MRIAGMDRRLVRRSTYFEQLRGRMPNLSAWSLIVCTIRRIPPRNLILKLYRVAHGTKGDGIPCGCKDGCLLRKIPIVGVVQRVLDKIAHEHLDACWRFRVPFEVVRRDARVCCVFGIGCLIEEYFGVVVESVFWRFPSSGRERSGCEGTCGFVEHGCRWIGRAAASYNRYSRDEGPQMAHEPCKDGWLLQARARAGVF